MQGLYDEAMRSFGLLPPLFLSKDAVEKYFAGLVAGVRLYAWWKGGEQRVGSTGRTLKEALVQIDTWEQAALKGFP